MIRIASLFLIISFFFGSLRFGFIPTLIFDASDDSETMGSYASGNLYGIAEEDVPSRAAVESLDISSVSAKVIDGLQHPVGDVDHISSSLPKVDYLVVYLQDTYSTWYYDNEEIFLQRKQGVYDWREYIRNVYFPRIKEAVNKLISKPYHDKLVYCLYNECDNGVWFGTWKDGYAEFDENGKHAFFEAWLETYNYVRSLDPNAVIGGPGYFEYNKDKIREFLTYCRDNDCIPDILIYHELNDISSRDWDLHAEERHKIENELGIEEITAIVTEYGTMQECGNPAAMLPYIRQAEYTKTYGNIAYWRLANNLNDNLAGANTPNSCWWLYRWYADMEGSLLRPDIRDLFHGDFAKAVKEERHMRYKYLNGFGSVNNNKDRIDILLGGADYSGQVIIENIKTTSLGRRIHIKIEAVTFVGLGGEVFAPYIIKEYDCKLIGNSIKICPVKLNSDYVYHIIVTSAEDSSVFCPVREGSLAERYEFEHGTLLGNAYTYDSAYATTGDISGMVGGMENTGDGVKLDFSVNSDGVYDLTFIYGKNNDGNSPYERRAGSALMSVDNQETIIRFPNTIKSEYTSSVTKTVNLKKGKHSVRFEHYSGTFVLDSMLVKRHTNNTPISVLRDSDRSDKNVTSYLCIAPSDGYYSVDTDADRLSVDDSTMIDPLSDLYLRKGFNYIDLEGADKKLILDKSDNNEKIIRIDPDKMLLSDGALIKDGSLSGITSNGGSASFCFKSDTGGTYRVTIAYSNNAEGGYHAYNVDLIEEYVTFTINGESQRVWCRNTYAYDNIDTVTFNVTLHQGKNEIEITNDGSVKFNNNTSSAPDIAFLEFAEITTE